MAIPINPWETPKSGTGWASDLHAYPSHPYYSRSRCSNPYFGDSWVKPGLIQLESNPTTRGDAMSATSTTRNDAVLLATT